MPAATDERRCAVCHCVLAADNHDQVCSPCAKAAWERGHAAEMALAEARAERRARARNARKPRVAEAACV
jgi:hypothetical protein